MCLNAYFTWLYMFRFYSFDFDTVRYITSLRWTTTLLFQAPKSKKTPQLELVCWPLRVAAEVPEGAFKFFFYFRRHCLVAGNIKR